MADEAKIGTHWREDELDAIVADYFAMLDAELSGQAEDLYYRTTARSGAQSHAGNLARLVLHADCVNRMSRVRAIGFDLPRQSFRPTRA